MKLFTIITTAFLVSNTTFAELKVPGNAEEGFSNRANRLERTHEVYPGEKIWYQFGRPYWKKQKTSKSMSDTTSNYQSGIKRSPAPINSMTNSDNIDADNDGILDRTDQCLNTPANVKVNLFGCRIDRVRNIDLSVKFLLGKAAIDNKYTEQLDKLGETMMNNKDLKIEIQGHTDNTGNKALNKYLSKMRSIQVKKYLTSKYDIPASRLVTGGYGDERPLMDNSTANGRRVNRRVEAKIISE